MQTYPSGLAQGVRIVCALMAAWVVLTVEGSNHAAAFAQPVDDYRQIIASRGRIPDTVRLEQLTSLYLKDRQQAVTMAAIEGQPARWVSRAAEVAAVRRRAPDALAAVRSIDEARLPAAARLEWRFLLHAVTAQANLARFPVEYVEPWPSAPASLQGWPPSLPHATAADYEPILEWLRGVPLRIAESMDLMRQGLSRGITAHHQIVEPTLAYLRSIAAADPLSTRYLAAFKDLASSSIPPEQQRVLLDRALEIYRGRIAPAYADLIQFLDKTYLPAARAHAFPAMSALPDGPAWYAARVRALTGLDLSPQEIHREAQAEVQRRQIELAERAKSLGFSGNYNDFVRSLADTPQCAPHVLDADGVRAHFQSLLQQVQQGLPKLFATIPKTPVEAEPGPTGSTHLSHGSPQPGSLSEGRPGRVRVTTPWGNGTCGFVNVMLHEGVPGHLLQMHVAIEHASPSDLRRQLSFQERMTFTEGWATYAQGLAEELGLNLNAQTRAHAAAGQMFMAARTVIDTGIHANGWTRDRAIDYYKATIGWERPENFEPVVDRVANEPAAYLAYFVGRQKIASMRARAERELGPRFDIRRFHDEILRNGPLPLDVLDAQISDWIASRQ